jgi:hypothetical protein
MAGVYTENQPDFAWLMPYEEKHFTQYFMPYRELGIVKNASKNLVMNIEETAVGAHLMLQATRKSVYRIVLFGQDDEILFDEVVELSPEEIFDTTIDMKGCAWQNIRSWLITGKKGVMPWRWNGCRSLMLSARFQTLQKQLCCHSI